MRGKRSAKPERCRLEIMIASKATSTTVSGSTRRTRPWSATVCSRKYLVMVAISASVRPV